MNFVTEKVFVYYFQSKKTYNCVHNYFVKTYTWSNSFDTPLALQWASSNLMFTWSNDIEKSIFQFWIFQYWKETLVEVEAIMQVVTVRKRKKITQNLNESIQLV